MTVSNYPEENVKIIRSFFLGKGLNEYAVAGLLGNLYAESRIKPTNLQNSYEKKTGLTDDTYTAAVDSGAYSTFTTDKAGYGLCQWTSSGRKTGLYNYVKCVGASIGDITAQLCYLWSELNGAYKKKVLNVLLKCTSVREAAEVVVCKFEVPASVIKGGTSKEKTIKTRTAYSQDFYDLYAIKTEVVTVASDVEINVCMLTKNNCYKEGRKITPKQIVVHSTGANNKTLKRYVQPDDGILGVNKYNNHWNKSGVNKCVNAFIGVDKNGVVRIYQTLPWTMRPWGCGSGKKGSYNNSAIQFEMCEDSLTDINYFNQVMDKAQELCAYLCKTYNIPVAEVVSHNEAYKRGYASGHSDCDNWLKKFGKNMDWFRDCVAAKLGSVKSEPVKTVETVETEPVKTVETEPVKSSFKVKVKVSSLNIRNGAGLTYKVVGAIKDKGTYTIVETKGNWGKLKSGAGWICITSSYVTRV